MIYLVFLIDECDQLALTIGRIMEEAGDKMEGNIDEIKINYSQRMQKLEEIIKKVKFKSIIISFLLSIIILQYKSTIPVNCIKRDFN